MSEELRNLLTRQASMSRLRFLTADPVVIAPGSRTAPTFTTMVLKYPGSGCFVPQSAVIGGFDGGDNIINPGPTTFTYQIKNMNGKLLYDAIALWNNSATGAANNFLSYYDTFDDNVTLCSTDWWYFEVYCFATTGMTAHAMSIGTEFLI